MQGGKVFWLYIIGQTFNIVLTFAVVWLLLSGKIFPQPDIKTFTDAKAEVKKEVAAPVPVQAVDDGSTVDITEAAQMVNESK